MNIKNDYSISNTFAEINIASLRKNFNTIKREANNTRKGKKESVKVCSIVKANGYGHGMLRISEELVKLGTDYLGTADYIESIKLRDHLKKRKLRSVFILCLGNLSENKKYFDNILSKDIEVTISEVRIARLLDSFARSKNKIVNVHIHVDTGMNRVGFNDKEVYKAVQKLKELEHIKIKGIYSHYATSEVPRDPFAIKQQRIFKSVISEIESNLLKFELKHMENTGGIINYRDELFNMIRPGISLYGYFPDERAIKKNIELTPVMTLKSKISFIKELEKSKSVSYGRNYFTKQKTYIASVPIGYGDGYSRILSNKSKAVINKKRYDVVGSVCMDWIMIDLKGQRENIKATDEVILMGREYPAYKLANIMKTIPYEITCNISQRVQRIYIER
ncbi:alanine racemase [Bacteroidota bacterium]